MLSGVRARPGAARSGPSEHTETDCSTGSEGPDAGRARKGRSVSDIFDEVDEEAFTFERKSKNYFRGTVVFDDEDAFSAHYVYNYMPHRATRDSLSGRS